ncbi:lipase domain-containing protein [Phthorimaea operculella]|nr:lipase domain-containing protein [Phthorimaea operculella]
MRWLLDTSYSIYTWIVSFISVSEICLMTGPVGDCFYCCPRDDNLDIQYKLFTRSNPTNFQIIAQGAPNLSRRTNFDPGNPTIIYLMGFTEATTGPSTTTLRDGLDLSRNKDIASLLDLLEPVEVPDLDEESDIDEIIPQEPSSSTRVGSDIIRPSEPQLLEDILEYEQEIDGEEDVAVARGTFTYLSAGDYNFISVDWSRLIAFPWYRTAVRNTRYMGSRLATFVQYLNSVGVPPSSLHVIGFSLGAEAAGFAGKELRSRGITLGRITGLDPAFPGYSLTNSEGHLSRGDAAFVDVIHTNPGIFGFPQPIGDVDFYPNGPSWIQPGCWINQLIMNNELDLVSGCSHNRAWRLYAESISNPRGFPATLCRDWTSWTRSCRFHVDGYMGIGARPPMTGKMYLRTNDRSPYARNGA